MPDSIADSLTVVLPNVSTTENTLPEGMMINPIKGLRVIVLVSFTIAALYCMIALASYNAADPGWSHSGYDRPVGNWAGVKGAWLADFLISFVGVGAYLFPLLLVLQGWLFCRGWRELGSWAEAVLFRWLALVALVVSTAALAEGIRLPFPTHLVVVGGGILGSEVYEALLRQFPAKGAGMFLVGTWLVALTLYADLSWLVIVETLGRWLLRPFARRPGDDRQEPSFGAAPIVEATAPSLPIARTRTNDPIEPESDTPPVAPRPPRSLPVGLMRMESPATAPNQPARPPDSPPVMPSPAPAAPPVRRAPQQRVSVAPAPVIPAAAEGMVLPPLELLREPDERIYDYSADQLEQLSRQVESILRDFNVEVVVADALPGPVITRFELDPAPGLKVSRVSGLAKDLARALRVRAVRVIEVIPGKSYIGLEIPNEQREIVSLRELLGSDAYAQSASPLTLVLGKDIAGRPVVANLAKMPHLLVAGTTGSGKSVAINAMILSLLYKATPEQVRLIMIDPKMLELSVYQSIPHLLTPVVTNMKEAANALRWSVAEMERRYQLMSQVGVRNLDNYNQKVREACERGQPLTISLPEDKVIAADGSDRLTLEPLPYIVIVVDELADLMMIVGKKVEEPIARIAQKARAAGLHLILATQRPSVDVLTGLIKANIPTRLSFQVSSRIDSRTILDQGGAESLLGHGDMLFLPPGSGIPLRAHGAFVDDDEVHRVVEFLRSTGPARYVDEITRYNGESSEMGSIFSGDGGDDVDPLYDEAVRFVTETRKGSISAVQRKFKIGYNRAARIVEEMERQGVVGPAESGGTREVIARPPPEL